MKKLIASLVIILLIAACAQSPKPVSIIPDGPSADDYSERPWNAPRTWESAETADRQRLDGLTAAYMRRRGETEHVGGGRQSGLHYSQAEELWIISRPLASAAVEDDQFPGTGALMTRRDEKEVPLPLEHTDVKAAVDGYIATVNVTQRFSNPFDAKIEAVYVFPLPENSAVNEFVMTIGERQIRGIIREREEATRIYNDARSQGYVASLLTQERPNIFTQSVANIEPGNRIDVRITYYNTLAYMDGWFEFAFPMVVGPASTRPARKRQQIFRICGLVSGPVTTLPWSLR